MTNHIAHRIERLALILLLAIFLLAMAACAPASSSGGKAQGMGPATPAPLHTLPQNVGRALVGQGDKFDLGPLTGLRVLVVGHLYDVFDADQATQDAFVSYVNAQNADLVVLGGDSFFGAQDDATAGNLDADWAKLDAFIARLTSRVVQVAGNHDGWSYDERFQAPAKAAFEARNATNFELEVQIGERQVGMYFLFTGDVVVPANRIAKFQGELSAHAENLVFGGHLENGRAHAGGREISLVQYLSSLAKPLRYFSGDWQANNTPIVQGTVQAWNTTSVCAGGFDATLIEVTETETTVQALGACGR